ncbi:MAG: hypothetical protein V3W34_16835 [Phycisphaerae bacterium]
MPTPVSEPDLEIRPSVRQRVLHIVESGGAGDEPMAHSLRACRIEADICPDVYRGLAGLERAGAGHYDAVIVCVDTLAAREFEFFTLAGRYVGGHRLLVYTATGSVRRVRDAVSRGATDVVEASPESLTRVLGSPSSGESEAAGASTTTGSPMTGWPMSFGHGGDDDTRSDRIGDATGPRSSPPPPPKEVGHPSVDRLESRSPADDVEEGPLLTPEEVEWLIFGSKGRTDTAGKCKGAV